MCPEAWCELNSRVMRRFTGETYRTIQQTLYAPIDGVDPQLGEGTAPLRPAANAVRPAAPATPASPAPPPAQPASATSNATRPDLMTHYRTLTARAYQDRLSLAQAERKLTLARSALPDESVPRETGSVTSNRPSH